MNNLKTLRSKIDKADQELIKALAKRQEVVLEIGKLKKKLKLPPLDQKRWQEVLESKIQMGEKLNLPKSLIVKIYNAIHEHSLEIESKTKEEK